ncbi:16S rRNA pseudouridine(516) synthase [Robbsia sp. KACC 23696]|uniref:16S rRNA pseudouridine(516) synthase n=1 Tax=Robbsia sp. KACC 23696 TaxID=3149231 RepID=UPI00325AFD23
MDLETLLFSQGFGGRRECRALIERGAIRIDGTVQSDADAAFATADLQFEVDGRIWPFHEKAYVMLHKPSGVECSRDPQHHPSVFSLLPSQLATRGLQCVGRLDQDTTGLLLLSDDGAFVHAMASPRRHVPKRYHATVKHALDDAQLETLRRGVLLHGETVASVPAAATMRESHELALTISEGKYHQVKRMVAAAGNRVEALHRAAIGKLVLPDDLAPGEWRWLTEADLVALRTTPN